MLAPWISLIGLVLDIVGFLILGKEFWKRGGNRLQWSADDPFWDRLGMILVVLGFIGQAAGQVTEMFSDG